MKNANEPAFPIVLEPEQTADIGLTKREYAAVHILGHLMQTHGTTPSAMSNAIKAAVLAADALLESLS